MNSSEDPAAGPDRTAESPVPAEIWVLVVSAFAIALGFGIVSPVLPLFAQSFAVSDAAASAIVSVFAGMRLLFAPLSGRLVQRRGERPVYLLGLLIVALSTGACAFAQGYWQLIVLRGLGGIGSTMFTVSSFGLVIRLSPVHSRGRVAGLYATSFLLGSIGGPLVGSALVGLGLRAPFGIYAVALLIAAAVVYYALQNSRLAGPAPHETRMAPTLRTALAKPAFRAVLWSNFANGWAVFGVRMALVPLFVVNVLGQEPGMAGIALTVFAVGNAIVLGAAGRMSDRYGRKPFLLAGTLVCGIGTIGMGYSTTVLWLCIASIVAGVGSGLITPVQQAAVADLLGSSGRSGPALAAFQMASDVGTVAGPVVAGALAERWSYEVAFLTTGIVLLIATAAWSAVSDTAPKRTAGSGHRDADQ